MKSLELNKPHMLVVVGLPGAGKSFFSKQFSDTFGTAYVDYNHYQRLIGNEELGDIVATDLLGQLFRTKQTIVIEGRGETVQDRQILVKLAKSKEYELLYIWVQTEPSTAKQRAVKSKTAAYSEEEFAERSSVFAVLDRTEPQVVISGRHTYASQAKMVLKRLVAQRSASAKPVVVPSRTIQKHSGRIIVG